MFPEPDFPVQPDEFIGRQVHLEMFQSSASTGRMASFSVLGDWGIGKSSLLLKLASTSSDSTPRMLPVTFSISKDISDYMRFAEALCDCLADALLASDSVAAKIRAEIETWKLMRVSVGALTVDRKPRQYFLSSGSALLRHALSGTWEHFIRPAYSRAVFFLDDLHNLATPDCRIGEWPGMVLAPKIATDECQKVRMAERGKFTTDLAQLSDKEIALLRAIAAKQRG